MRIHLRNDAANRCWDSGGFFQLEEIAQLGRTLWRRRVDILALFDHHAPTDPPKPPTDG